MRNFKGFAIVAGSTLAAFTSVGGILALVGGILALVSLLVFASTTPAQAQTLCGLHDKIVEHLARKYSEHPVGMGLTAKGNMIELLVSVKGQWTMLVTKPNKISCITATGQGWESMPEILSGQSL